MFQNQTHRAPTEAEKALLRTYSATGAGQGKDATQKAAQLNDAARIAPNPAPIDPAKAVPKTLISKSAVQNLLTGIILEIMADPAKASFLPKYTYVQSQVNAHDGDYQAADVAPYAQQMVADKLLSPDEVGALITDPDPDYRGIIPAGPAAFALLGAEVVVEASDFEEI